MLSEPQPDRGQLQRQRDTIQPPAQLRGCRRICGPTVKPGTRAAARSLQQPYRIRVQSFCTEMSPPASGSDIGGTVIRTSPATPRACRLVASSRSPGHEVMRVLGQDRAAVQQVLAVIQHQQQPPSGQVVRQ